MPRRFAKYEGLGNDFVVIDAARDDAVSRADASRLCDRRRGVGADGVLLVLPPRAASAVARMRVLNADGSTPEMCGNGLRCVALHLARRGAIGDRPAVVETDAGPRECAVRLRGESEADVAVDMGPVRATGRASLDVSGESFEVELADAGNPHAVLFGDEPRALAERLGARISAHPAFPGGTNAGFARVRGGAIDLVVWERGVGLTLACGTGACAAAVVARSRGWVPAGPVPVHLPGGELTIEPDPDGRTRMRGPARLVFEGTLA